MDTITTIGLDIAKSVFQVHGIDAAGNPVLRRQLKRRHVISFFGKLEPCLVGIEACASSHHWARELMALGHDVRLMPPAYGMEERILRAKVQTLIELNAVGCWSRTGPLALLDQNAALKTPPSTRMF